MRNLTLRNFNSYKLNSINDCEVFCVNNQIIFAYDRGIITKSHGSKEEVICDLRETLYPGDDHIPRAVELIYHYEKDLLFLILKNGDIISIETEKSGAENVVGFVEDGIKAAQWSPEQEVIALVNGDDNVIVITKDFEPVNEVYLHVDDLGEKQHISVGWGKKETQFHGSAGKYAAQQKQEVVLAKDDSITISWRGDAEYFVVSSINPHAKQRYLRIFNKAGILQYTSEILNGVENCLNWRPAGNLITSTQKLPNKYNVCFFEKNGMRHGEFSLPVNLSSSKVIEVCWSHDSKILAILLSETQTIGGGGDADGITKKYIYFYTVSNYKWYHKYTVSFTTSEDPISLKWNHQKPNVFHVITQKKNQIFHSKYVWNWVTNKSKAATLEDQSFVAVIDGYNVQLTAFKKGITPPPMCTYSISASFPVNSVSFAPDSSNDLLLHLSNGDIAIFMFCENLSHKLIGVIKSINNDSEFYFNCQWITSKKFLCNKVMFDDVSSKSLITIININEISMNVTVEKKDFEMTSNAAMVRVGNSGILLYDNCGKYSLLKEDNVLDIDVPENKNVLDVDIMEKGGKLFVISLDNSNKFYINSRLLFNNILSFHVHDKFILLTNMKHELLCLNSDDDLLNCETLPEVFKRRVERGSRLVTSVQKDMKVILQMPRGNLECIQPRALSIYTIGKYLDSLNFYEAFNLMRKQRINLNLIYDHDPNLFSNNTGKFIEQIKDPQWISLFISDISEEDVTKTMYSAAYNGKKRDSVISAGKAKVDIVCDVMEKALTGAKNRQELLLPILTCHIKRNKIESLENALSILKNLKERENSGEKPLVSFGEAFRYMLYLIDIEEIYKIALGMYDFDLVLIVATKSQKDPKEYLPFLNDLKNLEPHYQKYTIDKHLKRYEKALKNLVLCEGDDRFSECISFIKAHHLFKAGLKMIPQNTDRYKTVCLCYGEELMKSGLYEEAGIMFSNAGKYQNAMNAYKKSGNWHEVLNCVGELELSDKELNEVYLDLAKDLVESKDFSNAAIIYLDYLKDIEEGVKVLAAGKLFGEAYRISCLHGRPELIPRFVVPVVVQQVQLTALQIAEFRSTFERQCQRLRVVRMKRLEDDNRKEYEMDSDVFSESSTVITQSQATSRGTNRTYRSAKNRRKQERKLLSLKEGSPYEHLALVVALHNLVSSSLNLMMEVKEMNKFLVKINKYELAEKLQKDYEDYLKLIESTKSEIWTSELLNNKQSFGPDATSNEIASVFMRSENVPQNLLEPKYAIPPEIPKLKWKLDIIKT